MKTGCASGIDHGLLGGIFDGGVSHFADVEGRGVRHLFDAPPAAKAGTSFTSVSPGIAPGGVS